MKIAYAAIPIALAALQIAVAFSGCGSSTSEADAGPACEPACVDVAETGLGDVMFADTGSDGGGLTCATLCDKLSTFKGCPDPGCAGECSRQDVSCTGANAFAAFQALLSCEVGATYTCSFTSPPLPVTGDCATQSAAVADSCFPEGGTSDAGCSGIAPANCAQCCKEQHTGGANTYNTALRQCACDSPTYACASACENSECANSIPEAGSMCSDCLAYVLADGGCGPPVTSECSADPDCLAFQSCLTTNKCPTSM